MRAEADRVGPGERLTLEFPKAEIQSRLETRERAERERERKAQQRVTGYYIPDPGFDLGLNHVIGEHISWETDLGTPCAQHQNGFTSLGTSD